ncbi:unnamed protein product [Rangifer tarandus platyrhynchus]|uniref:Uncharacterized protein n=2 Tax=Rangifer tarandus platyrhynchus TaxID=3082113 RepID=A0ACB0EHK7_RANTA|nr:unnamed protein product [Rangifer tarandus platyrhynchus]CAI9700202.1 unnamed protein product [Rangifer tarandus platyrhynchus]
MSIIRGPGGEGRGRPGGGSITNRDGARSPGRPGREARAFFGARFPQQRGRSQRGSRGLLAGAQLAREAAREPQRARGRQPLTQHNAPLPEAPGGNRRLRGPSPRPEERWPLPGPQGTLGSDGRPAEPPPLRPPRPPPSGPAAAEAEMGTEGACDCADGETEAQGKCRQSL